MLTTPTRLLIAVLIAGAFACSAPVRRDEPMETSRDRIVGGSEAREGAWPGTVALYGGTAYDCGGALIADEWVVTAGHCVHIGTPDGGVTKVVIGRRDLTSTTGEERTVDRFIRHEGFTWQLDNDIALLHLSAPSTAPKSKLITTEQLARVVDGAGVTVVGWGSVGEGQPMSNVLLQATVPILPSAQCATYANYKDLSANMICAGFVTGDYDSCQGDSGGPLFMKLDGAPVQLGIVSWGIGCARPNQPGVYTRLGNYLGWIHEKTEGAVGSPPAAAVDAGPTPAPSDPGPAVVPTP